MSELGDGQALVLRDLTTGVEVRLEDAALPKRGVETPAKLRHVTTWYPGGPSASTQIMGIEEEPIPLEGRFSDTLMGAVDAAAAKVAELRAIFVAQHHVELAWGRLIIRRGLISRWVPRYEGQSLIGWKLEFLPTEVDEPMALIPITYPETPATVLAWWQVLDAACDAALVAAALAATAKAMI